MITATDQITVVVVDDHPLVRKGLMALLEREADLTVVGEAGSVADAVRRAAFDEPDVVTLDVNLPDGSGLDACQPIKTVSPKTKVLILTAFADPHILGEAHRVGADGFVLKRTGDMQLVERIRRVAEGGTAFDDAPPPDRSNGGVDHLTRRELAILELIAEGKTNREIADTLFLAEKTVKNYVSNLLSKLGVKNRSAAAAYLIRRRASEEYLFPPSEWPAS